MILGVTGLAGSGKDTFADFLVKTGFVKVALADPLKRICRDIFDFTDEQLWGPSSKRNEPDLRYSNKDRFVDAHEEECQRCRAVRVSPVSGSARPASGPSSSLHRQPCPEGGLHDIRQSNLLGTLYLTPRHALQQLGTEYGRKCYENIWVDYCLRTAKKILRKDYANGEPIWRYHQKLGIYENGRYVPKDVNSFQHHQLQLPRGVVISDVRFKNEIDAIHAAGGYIVKLTRGRGLEGSAGMHQSETEQLGFGPELIDAVIDNEVMSLADFEATTLNCALRFEEKSK